MQVVDVQFYIAQLRPLDTRAQDYGFDGYMRAWWHDPRLAYNGTADGGAFDNLNLGAYEKANIWKPEFYWEGARTIVMPDTNKGTGELIWVSPDGSVWWSRQTAFIVSCPFASGTNLNQLHLFANQLTGHVPESLTHLPLHTVYMQQNHFACPFPCFRKYSPYANFDCSSCPPPKGTCYPC